MPASQKKKKHIRPNSLLVDFCFHQHCIWWKRASFHEKELNKYCLGEWRAYWAASLSRAHASEEQCTGRRLVLAWVCGSWELHCWDWYKYSSVSLGEGRAFAACCSCMLRAGDHCKAREKWHFWYSIRFLDAEVNAVSVWSSCICLALVLPLRPTVHLKHLTLPSHLLGLQGGLGAQKFN